MSFPHAWRPMIRSPARRLAVVAAASAPSARRPETGGEPKIYGDDPLVDRHRQPDEPSGSDAGRRARHAKSMLSELLAAAISGTDPCGAGLAGTTEDHIRYSWNYALLLAEGPTERALRRLRC